MRVKIAQRILWLSVIPLLLFGLLGQRLYQFQIVGRHQGHDLVETAYSQRTQSLPLQMRRGLILDRNGVALTSPESSQAIGIFPRLLGDGAAAAGKLSQVLTQEQVEQLLAYARSSQEPAWVLEGVQRESVEQIKRLGLPGIVTGPTGNRYGSDSLARHLVGYANDTKGGVAGLEMAYDQELSGDQVPYLAAAFDGKNRLLGGIREVQPRTGKQPYDLFTTLDARIQAVVEEEMDKTLLAGGGFLRGAVVVMDAVSGDLLAAASRPNYIQTEFPEGDLYSPLTNRVLTAYEPGSVFKSLVAAAALEAGVVSPDEEFNCTGEYKLGANRFTDSGGKGHGRLTFAQAVAKSCNITFIKVGYERLGATRLLQAAREFGLGSPTGILPGESPGHLPELNYGGDVAQFSFGQGSLMVTPLQLARAYAAIANGGVLPPVRLVTAVKTPAGEVVDRPAVEAPRRIMSQKTARQLQELLRGVTRPGGGGTGEAAWVPGSGSAGKTGSAETVQGGRKVTHAWFAGWFPADSPRYVIVVLVEDGKAGGLVAAPIFSRIARQLPGK